MAAKQAADAGCSRLPKGRGAVYDGLRLGPPGLAVELGAAVPVLAVRPGGAAVWPLAGRADSRWLRSALAFGEAVGFPGWRRLTVGVGGALNGCY